jgi:hypothetical protein
MPEVQRAYPLGSPQGMAHQQNPGAARPAKGSDAAMTVTFPLVAIIGLVVFIAYRYMGLRVWHALISLIFGLLIAATSAAPEINRVLAAIVQWFQRP